MEELFDEIENQEGESSIQTNKIIKEAIGQESDFDMILCATSSNLDDLIEKKDTERGRLLSRWIGLLPIEQKDALAREKFNSNVKPYLLSNRYNTETLKQEIDSYNINITTLVENVNKLKEANIKLDTEIQELDNNKSALLQSKTQIDENLLKVDSTTLEAKLSSLSNDGKVKTVELQNLNDELNSIGDVEFKIEEFDAVSNELSTISLQIGECRATCNATKASIQSLKSGEFCPTCGKKYDNVDNSSKIQAYDNSTYY